MAEQTNQERSGAGVSLTSETRVFHSYLCKETSAEVWAVLRARHGKEFVVFSTFSDPDGTQFDGDGTRGRMETTYGFRNSDNPIIGACTTWDIGEGDTRSTEQTTYFLMIKKDGVNE
jgi:hypothetical protein